MYFMVINTYDIQNEKADQFMINKNIYLYETSQ